MSITDPISDMLTGIRNALSAKHEVVEMRHSVIRTEIARILKREGYITDYVVEGGGIEKSLRMYLKYVPDNVPAIEGLKRISKPGLRRYVGAKGVPRPLGGLGIAIVSTSSGIVTDGEARKKNIGGEILCEVW